MKPTQPTEYQILLRCKAARSEVDLAPVSSANIKNEWSYTSLQKTTQTFTICYNIFVIRHFAALQHYAQDLNIYSIMRLNKNELLESLWNLANP